MMEMTSEQIFTISLALGIPLVVYISPIFFIPRNRGIFIFCFCCGFELACAGLSAFLALEQHIAGAGLVAVIAGAAVMLIAIAARALDHLESIAHAATKGDQAESARRLAEG